MFDSGSKLELPYPEVGRYFYGGANRKVNGQPLNLYGYIRALSSSLSPSPTFPSYSHIRVFIHLHPPQAPSCTLDLATDYLLLLALGLLGLATRLDCLGYWDLVIALSLSSFAAVSVLSSLCCLSLGSRLPLCSFAY